MGVKTRGFEAFRQTMKNIAADMPQICDVLASVAAQTMEERAKQNAPVLTGFMRDSIYFEQIAPGVYAVVSPAPYSGFNNFGFIHWISHVFVPGSFFFTNAFTYTETVLREGGAAEIVKAEMLARKVPESDDG